MTSEFTVSYEPSGLVMRELSPATWLDFETLFESRGGPKNCWCMVWREKLKLQAGWTEKEQKKATMRDRVFSSIPNGLVGYLGGRPVAWCSVAPKRTFRKLSEVVDNGTENVWSIVCFYVQTADQRKGIQRLLLKSAVEYAKFNGCTSVEAYPVDRDSPSYRFMGFTDLFESAGFQQVGHAGTRRRVYRMNFA